jgi:glycosyltransferase involved in cell wall biosynthesis
MTETHNPLVSIAMPVFGCEKTLGLTIRSILHQSLQDWELLIIDDGSPDKTVEIGRSFKDPRILVIADGLHLGIPRRRNQAIEMSRGKYFGLIDGDDLAYPERLERQVRYLRTHSEVDLVGCGVLVFRGDGRLLGTREVRMSHQQICERPWAGFHLAQPTWIGKGEWFRTHGYRVELARAEDQDLLLRTYKTSCFAALPDILVGYREESLSLRKNFVGRYSFCRSLLREAFQHKDYLLALRGIWGQSLKGLADFLAISTGLNHRALRHRARPVEDSVRERWEEVWELVADVDPKLPSPRWADSQVTRA